MKTTVEPIRSAKLPLANLVLFSFEGEDRPAGGWRNLDSTLQQKYAQAAANEGYRGREKQLLVFYPADTKPARRVLVAGLGKKANVDTERVRRAVSAVVKKLTEVEAVEAAVLPPIEESGLGSREVVQSIVEAASLTLYRFDSYKTQKNGDKKKSFDHLRILQEREKESKDLKEGARLGELFARGTCLTRDLINEPAMTATPRRLAEVAQEISRGKKSITVKVFDEKQVKAMNMGGLLAVAAGSDQPPRFVHLSYKAPGAKKTIAIVGKGITFDSGGLCIKPADGMLNMKDDMSGAAAVLGLFSVLDEVRPPVNVLGIFAATENMTGGSAYKMRDIVRAMNGKTMEIVNTDAEGRVILADALSYASKLAPQEIIDLATLTGACVVALGTKISGIFSNDSKLSDRLISSSRQAGEKLWPLPLEEEYKELIKSETADLKNSGGRWAGAITAALFLKEFVAEGIPWAHIDMAGECFSETAEYYKPAGASGAMVRTLLRYLQSS